MTAMKDLDTNEIIQKLSKHVVCPVELALRIVGGKWRGSILYQLRNGALRFNKLKFQVQDAVVDYGEADNYLTNKVLSNHLKDLIAFQLVTKNNGDIENPSYELTTKGNSVIPILLDLYYWGENQYKLPMSNHLTQ